MRRLRPRQMFSTCSVLQAQDKHVQILCTLRGGFFSILKGFRKSYLIRDAKIRSN